MEHLERHKKENTTTQVTTVNSTVIILPAISVHGDRGFCRGNRKEFM